MTSISLVLHVLLKCTSETAGVIHSKAHRKKYAEVTKPESHFSRHLFWLYYSRDAWAPCALSRARYVCTAVFLFFAGVLLYLAA